MWVYVPEYVCPQRSKDGIVFPVTGASGYRESPDVDAGNQTNSGLLEKQKTLQMLTSSPVPDPIFVTNYLQGSKLLLFGSSHAWLLDPLLLNTVLILLFF